MFSVSKTNCTPCASKSCTQPAVLEVAAQGIEYQTSRTGALAHQTMASVQTAPRSRVLEVVDPLPNIHLLLCDAMVTTR